MLREIEEGVGVSGEHSDHVLSVDREGGAGYGDFQITLQCVKQRLSPRTCVSSFPTSVTAGGAWGTRRVHRDSSPAA